MFRTKLVKPARRVSFKAMGPAEDVVQAHRAARAAAVARRALAFKVKVEAIQEVGLGLLHHAGDPRLLHRRVQKDRVVDA